MFWCVISLYIFISCAIFWRAYKASQNANEEQKYTTPKHLISDLLII